MSDNLPALPTDIEWTQLKEIAAVAYKSRLLPESIQNVEAATIIALKGRELGIAPMVAFAHINVIKGKPCCSSELMLAHIRKDFPNAVIEFTERTDKACKISAKRKPEDKMEIFEMTYDQAEKAGFAKQWDSKKSEWYIKDNWKKIPKTMLSWRCVSEMKRFLFPEVLMGVDYTPDELDDIKDVTPTQPPPEQATAEKKVLKNFAPGADNSRAEKPIDVTPEPPKLDERKVAIEKIIALETELNLNKDMVDDICARLFGRTEKFTTNDLNKLVVELEGMKNVSN